jgi:hypothetical protein
MSAPSAVTSAREASGLTATARRCSKTILYRRISVICAVILAQVAGVDLGKALVAKMDAVDKRVAVENLTDA